MPGLADEARPFSAGRRWDDTAFTDRRKRSCAVDTGCGGIILQTPSSRAGRLVRVRRARLTPGHQFFGAPSAIQDWIAEIAD